MSFPVALSFLRLEDPSTTCHPPGEQPRTGKEEPGVSASNSQTTNKSYSVIAILKNVRGEWGMGVLPSTSQPLSLFIPTPMTLSIPSLSDLRLATLLDFCVCVCASVRPCVFLVLQCIATMNPWAWVPFLQILVPALSVCFIFTVTIGVFPAVTAEVKSSFASTSTWGEDTIGSQGGDRQGLELDCGWGRRDPGLPSPQLDSSVPFALPWAKSISTLPLGKLSPSEGQGC